MTDQSHERTLEPLGLTSDEYRQISNRRIESMNKRQIFSTVIIYGTCSFLIFLGIIFGPAYYISQTMSFQPDIHSASSTRRYQFDFTGLHFFNDFLTCELILNKTNAIIPSQYKNSLNLSIYFTSTMNLGSKTIFEGSHPIQHVTAEFPENENLSQPIRIYSTGIVTFNKMKGFITLKFPQSTSIGGDFIWSFADPAHSMFQLFIRLVFSIIALIIFLRLLLSDFDFHHSHISMRLMFILDILLIIGSDPFYILTYFASTYVIKLYDCIVSIFLLLSVAFTAFSVLLMTGLKHRDVTFKWIVVRFIPFLIAFFVFASSSGYAVICVDKDPISRINVVTKVLDLLRVMFYMVYAIAIGRGAFVFQSDVPGEKLAMVLMTSIFFVLTLISELFNAFEPFLGSDFAIQIFSLFSCAVYILFFNFLNWPVDSSAVMRKEVNDEEIHVDNAEINQVLSPTVTEI